MWISKANLRQLLRDTVETLRNELIAERTARAFAMQRMAETKTESDREVAELRRRLAISQANFEWLSLAFNRSEAERSQLLLGRMGIVAPPMTVATGAMPQVPVATDTREVRGTPLPDEATLAEQLASGSLFEDVGNQKARALGLEDGNVYAGIDALTRTN